MEKIKLKPPRPFGTDFYEVLKKRRTVREFDERKEVDEEKLSFLLWATYGITDKEYELKTAPSAGARYPLKIYVANKIGIFEYIPKEHSLVKITEGDLRNKISKFSFEQEFIEEAPIIIMIFADFERTISRYGKRGIRYVYIDAGHAAQNLLLAAEYLGLGACPVGAFEDEKLKKLLNIEFEPIYVLPVGYKKY